MAKKELIGGHIGFMLNIEMAKIEITRRPYWLYANCRDGENRNNWRPHENYACYRDYQDKINRRPY